MGMVYRENLSKYGRSEQDHVSFTWLEKFTNNLPLEKFLLHNTSKIHQKYIKSELRSMVFKSYLDKDSDIIPPNLLQTCHSPHVPANSQLGRWWYSLVVFTAN